MFRRNIPVLPSGIKSKQHARRTKQTCIASLLPVQKACTKINIGRAKAQAVSRRLPTAAPQVRAQVRSCGISGRQSGTGAGFLRVLRFPLPNLIPPTAPHSPSIIRGWYNRPSGLSLTPLQENKKKIKIIG
jgi:hypothetical protein